MSKYTKFVESLNEEKEDISDVEDKAKGKGKGKDVDVDKNADTVKTKGDSDESKDVNKTTKVNAKENYRDFKASLNEAGDRLKKSKEICNAIKAQTDNKEIITMADGIISDIDKGQLTPKQSEWIYKTSTSMKK